MTKIYLVLSQTGTIFSKALKFFTRAEYNHISLSLNSNLNKMYSFGRLNPYNAFKGGFVEEGIHTGTFKRFYNTTAMILELEITTEKYEAIKYFIDYFLEHKNKFHYNYLGIILACLKKNHSPSTRYYCSQFVRMLLDTFDIDNAKELPKIIKPIDFLKLNHKNIIYKGLLQNYQLINK